MADEQLNYRIGEIFRLVTNLVEQGKEHGQKLGGIDQKISALDRKVDLINGQLTDVIDKVLSHENRISVIEESNGPGIDLH